MTLFLCILRIEFAFCHIFMFGMLCAKSCGVRQSNAIQNIEMFRISNTMSVLSCLWKALHMNAD